LFELITRLATETGFWAVLAHVEHFIHAAQIVLQRWSNILIREEIMLAADESFSCPE